MGASAQVLARARAHSFISNVAYLAGRGVFGQVAVSAGVHRFAPCVGHKLQGQGFVGLLLEGAGACEALR